MPRTITRAESKRLTRQRLLDAAIEILSESGSSKLSTGNIARRAGVAQPTFYVHFRDKDELLRTLAESNVELMRAPLRQARANLGQGAEPVRSAFRIPLDAMLNHPELFVLSLRERLDDASPFGARARELTDELKADLRDDLVALGVEQRTKRQREKLALVVDALVGLTETMALGLIEKRYDSIEATVDLLIGAAQGMIPTLAE